jgi:RNA ligase (TIGR02306 family)
MKLASLEIIKGIKTHPNADSLELAQVLGWQAVVKKGEFQAGDKVVFVVIDTILPDQPWSSFLKDKKDPEKPIRLKTIKLRGEYSQGLVLPLSVLDGNEFSAASWQEGADVGGILGVKKFEKEIPACLSGEIIGSFPQYLAPKTDEDNGLSNPDLVAEVLKHPLTVTLKLDGSSCTIIVDRGEITHVCSRNMQLAENEGNAFWRVARQMRIPQGWNGVIQGELMGPGVQGNQLRLMEPKLYVYQIREGIEGYLNYSMMINLTEFELGLNYVPAIWSSFMSSNPPEALANGVTLTALQELADSLTLEDGSPAEGIVVRPARYIASGIGRPLGFKLISRNYKD